MLALWMVYLVVVSLCVAAAAYAVERVFTIWGLPRRGAWIAAIIAVVSLPLAMVNRRAPVERATRVAPARKLVVGPRATTRVAPRVVPLELRAFRVAARIEPYVRRGWMAASLVALLVFARGAFGLARRRSAWRRDRLDGGMVLVAPDAGPAVVGVLRPMIVVPEWALALDRTELALMLRHEREHLDAADPRALLVATLALILFPWNVALWWMAHRLRLSVEIDCDARVLRAIDAPREYGMLLLAVGERRSLALPMSASLAERRSLLERRIHAMTTPHSRRPILASLPFAGLALAASIAAAQSSPPPAGIVAKATAEAYMTSEAMIKSTTLSPAQVQAILAAHHPAALLGDPDMSRIAIVLDANDNYVRSVVRAPEVGVAAKVELDSAQRAAIERKMVLARAVEAAAGGASGSVGYAMTSDANGSVAYNKGFAAGSTFGVTYIQGIGEIRGEDIRAIESVRYAAGEMGTGPLNVLIVKLK
jgi:hypothetical protein